MTHALRVGKRKRADTRRERALPRLACRIGHEGRESAGRAGNGHRIGDVFAGGGMVWAPALGEGTPDESPDVERVSGQEVWAAPRSSVTRRQRAS